MITESDAGNILYRDCSVFGVPIYQGLRKAFQNNTERIIIIPKQQQKGGVWDKCYIEVNWFIPDTKEPNLIRLHEIERLLRKELNGVGQYDSTTYRYSIESTQILEASDYKSHYANARVMFKAMNF